MREWLIKIFGQGAASAKGQGDQGVPRLSGEAEPAAIDLLSPEVLKQIQGIQLRVRHLVNDVMAGEYESTFKGRGVEFEEVRTYQPGDDVRSIDWNVTARMGVPFVKEFREERELTVLLVVDVSGSSLFGTTEKFKHEVAAEVAAMLAYTAIHSNDKVGLLTFSDQVERYIPPKKGRSHVWRVIREILTHRGQARTTNLQAALDYLGRVLKRKAVIFLVSDFIGEGFEDPLRRLTRRHEVVALAITDPREAALPPIGFLELEDAESGEQVVLDTNSESFRTAFERRGAKRQVALSRLLASMDVDLISISTDRPYLDPIVQYFRHAQGHGRRKAFGHGGIGAESRAVRA